VKLVLIGVGAFVLSLVGGTAIRVVTAPPPGPVPAAAHADSSAAETPPAATTEPVTAVSSVKPVPARSDSTPLRPAAPAATRIPAPVADSVADAARVPSAPQVVAAPREAESYKTVAKILSTMKPDDAAQILAQLSDPQVEGILRAAGVRGAAIFMGKLPATRAAAMSRRLMLASAREGK